MNLIEINNAIEFSKSKVVDFTDEVEKNHDINRIFDKFEVFIIESFKLEIHSFGCITQVKDYSWKIILFESEFEKTYKFGCKDDGYGCMSCHNGSTEMFYDIIKNIAKELIFDFVKKFEDSF